MQRGRRVFTLPYITVADPDLQLRRGPAFKGLTMNVEFCEDNFAICAISEKIRWGAGPLLNNKSNKRSLHQSKLGGLQ